MTHMKSRYGISQIGQSWFPDSMMTNGSQACLQIVKKCRKYKHKDVEKIVHKHFILTKFAKEDWYKCILSVCHGGKLHFVRCF